MTFEERVIQECDRWLEGEPDAEITEPADFYVALTLIKVALVHATNRGTAESAIAKYTRYVGQVPANQRTRYDARWRASRQDSSSGTRVASVTCDRA
jgi:hypothetical protein